MNQVAISTVLIRLFGLYVFLTGVIQFCENLWVGGRAMLPYVFSMLLAYSLIGVGITLVARKVSGFLFTENKCVVGKGRISESALMSVGVALIGVYLFGKSAPSLISMIADMALANGAKPTGEEYLDFADLMMSMRKINYTYEIINHSANILVACILVFRRRTICGFINHVSR